MSWEIMYDSKKKIIVPLFFKHFKIVMEQEDVVKVNLEILTWHFKGGDLWVSSSYQVSNAYKHASPLAE